MSDSKSVVSLNPRTAGCDSDPDELADRALRAQRRADREMSARHEAERLLESKSLELWETNKRLMDLNAELEERVVARTLQLEDARRAAVEVSTTDHLTAIPNRHLYSAHLHASLLSAGVQRRATGLLLVDLDGFKTINDTYGHAHGDELLRAVASRLRKLARSDELVSRIGGDEFAIVFVAEDAASIMPVAERFREVFEEPVTIQGVTIYPRGSFGLAISPDHCETAVDLQRFADLALYKSKKAGNGEIVLFEKAFVHAYEYRQRMESEFRVALKSGKIELNYQPIVQLRTGKTEAVEALARWTDSAGVQISPNYFIPLAEQCGIIRGVGRSLLKKALFESRPWTSRGLIDRVTFNISPLELLDPGFSDVILKTLTETDVNPRHLLLEITEGSAIQNLDQAGRVMHRLRTHGVKFALDDFGCGYSDLSNLRKLPICVLKIDRSLLVDAEADHAARAILRNVVAMCTEIGIKSVCEGAETNAQLEILRGIRCDSVQGFAVGRPANAVEIDDLLRSSELGRSSRTQAGRSLV